MNWLSKILLWLSQGKQYSTSEKWTGKYWIDGKKIYRKTIDCGALPSSTNTKSLAHNIANLKTIIGISGTAIGPESFSLPAAQIYIPVITGGNSSLGYVGIRVDSIYVYLNAGRNVSQLSGYVTLEYTCTDR